MITKTNKILGVVLGMLFLGSSCEMNNLPLDSISPNTFFYTESDLKLYTNSFYNMLPDAEGVYNERVDNIISTDLSDELRGTRIVPTSDGGWIWSDLRNINYFLVNSHRCPDSKAVMRYNGVARFFRAYFYFEKVKRFGDVPWYSEPLEANDEKGLKKGRDSRILIMDSVLVDIDYAIANLPAEIRVNEITKWTALALKSRICLFEGTFRKYHTEFNLPNANRFLDEAISAADNLMRNGPYVIYNDNTGKAYQNLFSSMDAISSEVILARNFDDGLQVYHNLNYYTMTASYGRPGLEKRLVNSYLMKDGSRFTDIAGYEKMGFYEEIQNRDPRLSQTIRTPGYTRIGETTKLVQEFGATVTGYQLIKYVTERKWDTYAKSANDMPIFRYAEVLLNYAEAKAERGTVVQEDIDRSIKHIRDRVNMPNMDVGSANKNPDPYQAEIYPGVTGNNKGIILEIRRERRIELVMENFRWDDIMRWKEGTTLTKQFKGMYFPGTGSFDLDNDGTTDVVIYEGETKPDIKNIQLLKLNGDITLEHGNHGGNILINPHIEKVFDENKDYLYPIPISERLLNPSLTQNPGWKDGL